MYIYPRRRSRRIPILIGCAAFVCTLLLIFGFALFAAPERFLAVLTSATAKLYASTTELLVTLTPTAVPTAVDTDTPTPRPTRTPRPTNTPAPSPTLVPTATPVDAVSHFLFGRPVPPDADGIIPDWTYLYGDTQHGDEAVHHGEEFVNPIGTPLLAVADGTAVVAGDDSQPRCGDSGNKLCGPAINFYGNLVVLKLDGGFEGESLYVLYGHMDSVAVQPGQHVTAGDKIGTIGDTGIALGPHVHFEVRLGVNDYGHTRNPLLWMKPLAGYGIAAGSVLDRSGNFLRGVNVFLYLDNATQDYVQDTESYGRDLDPSILPVNSDDRLHENWAMGDLKAGKYLLRVQIGQLNYVKHITIEDGQMTLAVFGGP